VLLALAALFGVQASAAGAYSFPEIRDASAPEQYAFSMELSPQLHLEQIDERTVGVFYSDGFQSFVLDAGLAHAADGATVPTSLAMTGPEEVTLTVHYKAGNPAAGGAPFALPIIGGKGWEGGYRTTTVELNEPKPPPAAAPQSPPPPAAAPSPHVFVTRALGEGATFYRPRRFLLSADGTFGINGVDWHSYDGPTAKATGRAYVNDCDPDCADGHFSKPKVTLRLSKVVECGGRPLYARLSYRLTGSVPQGFPRHGTLSMLPRTGDGSPDC
jgi:hypothetical protein